jgi:hypothetical protein
MILYDSCYYGVAGSELDPLRIDTDADHLPD